MARLRVVRSGFPTFTCDADEAAKAWPEIAAWVASAQPGDDFHIGEGATEMYITMIREQPLRRALAPQKEGV